MTSTKVPLTFRVFKGDQLICEERLSLHVIKIGRVPSAHLKLDDETVSRIHAIIEVNASDDVSIIDLGSTSGTFVNGLKVNKAKLQSGNTIVVGKTRIELVIGAKDEDAPIKHNPISTAPLPSIPDEHAREMFGCTAQSIDLMLQDKDPRDIAMYAMGVLSNAQELFQRAETRGSVQWSVPPDRANTVRQLMNVAKYAIDKAVPR